jgi:hypothetical protein
MQNCNSAMGHSGGGAHHEYSPLPYKFQEMDDDEMQMQSGSCNGYDLSVEPVAVSAASHLNSTSFSHVNVTPQYAMYGQTTGNCSSQMRKSDVMNTSGGGMATAAYNDTLNYQGNHMTQSKLEQRDLGCSLNMESLQAVHGGMSPRGSGLMVPLRHNQLMTERNHGVSLGHHRVGSPDQPSSSTDLHECNMKQMRSIDISNGNGGGGGSGGGMEEISTRDVAQRVSNELKRYSIPQAVFAQRVLGRSQGTLSDLLRNPKPWSKLKSGRETFRRMWKWLQEPEYQRMAALRSGIP